MTKQIRNIAAGGARWSVTLTFELDDGRTVTGVYPSQKVAAQEILSHYGRPRRLRSISTPGSIYADLIGLPAPPPVKPELAVIFREQPEPWGSKLKLSDRERRMVVRRRLGLK